MVTIIGYSLRTNQKGEDFFALILQGGIELVKSKLSDLHYATAMRCIIPSTFNEQTCQSMIGDKLPGKILKKDCDPFTYVNKTTGEESVIKHRYVYLPEGTTLEEVVYEGVPQTKVFK